MVIDTTKLDTLKAHLKIPRYLYPSWHESKMGEFLYRYDMSSDVVDVHDIYGQEWAQIGRVNPHTDMADFINDLYARD